ncbi:alpha/beta hydrolase [Lolliginicoccus levis]|uniref:alpha/beta hydrolase n=1 Tax=Lolliginicoccus levis TaxID=2919542 RepID=UPI00241FB294|nr:alpha/beta hydrolase family protein [Lolliginicoccus levis]
MRFAKPRVSQKWRQRVLAVSAAALVVPMAAGLTGGAIAAAQPATAAQAELVRINPSPWGDRYQRHSVFSPSMGINVQVDVLRAAGGGSGALYLLDGLRARDDASGWQIETNALEMFADSNVNVVLPVGGRSSFYADWYGPSSTNGQPYTYKWETFLTSELPGYLSGLGIRSTGNAIAGLSMAGSAALKIAADHKPMFNYAASFSGYLNLSAPGMPSLIRLALLDEGGYNVDDMWGPPWDPAWAEHDPTVFADELAGIQLYISAGNGVPGAYTRLETPVDYFNTANAMGLEVVAMLNARAFEGRANALGLNATFSYPPTGVHAWGYWQDELSKARPGILAAVGG